MTKIQFGAIITGAKGKIGGQVFQGGNTGAILRNKGYTAGIASVNRQVANSSLSAVTRAWRGITDLQRTAWASLQASWTFTDKFGTVYQGSPFQIYTSYNSALASLGLAAVTTPAALASPTTFTINSIQLSADTLGHCELDVQFNETGATNDMIIVFASAPRSAGKNTNHVRYKKIGVQSLSGTDTATFSTQYQAAWGFPPVGSSVVVKYVIYNKTYPRATQVTITSTVVILF